MATCTQLHCSAHRRCTFGARFLALTAAAGWAELCCDQRQSTGLQRSSGRHSRDVDGVLHDTQIGRPRRRDESVATIARGDECYSKYHLLLWFTGWGSGLPSTACHVGAMIDKRQQWFDIQCCAAPQHATGFPVDCATTRWSNPSNTIANGVP